VFTSTKAAAVEAWHRMRTDIEDRIRDAKHGAALRHLPSGNRTVNTVWMWGALLAVNLSAWLQELAGLDHGDGRGRAHLGTLRHRLLNIPARLVRHASQPVVRLPQASSCWPRSWPDYEACPSGPDRPAATGPSSSRRPANRARHTGNINTPTGRNIAHSSTPDD
jgi:hypothetical protein